MVWEIGIIAWWQVFAGRLQQRKDLLSVDVKRESQEVPIFNTPFVFLLSSFVAVVGVEGVRPGNTAIRLLPTRVGPRPRPLNSEHRIFPGI